MINTFKGEYRWLSNFWPVAIPYEGILYTSVENAYQAAKTLDQTDREKISLLPANKAKSYGKKLKIREDWDNVKLSIMRELVTIKFTTDPNLKKLLMDTHPQPLIEGNTWGDVFWGVWLARARMLPRMSLRVSGF